MTPQAEVWLPEEVSKKDFENFLKPIGGRIDKFQESKPIPVGEISPFSMAAFFRESHPDLRFGPVPIYPAIFSELRDLPLDEQEKLLVGFYSQKVEAFPNGAELGRFLARINNISWFQPKSPPDRESLERFCHQALSRLNLPDLTLRIIKEARGAAWETAWKAARETDRDTVRYAAQHAAWEAAWGAVWEPVREAAWDATQVATRIAAQVATWGTTWEPVREAAWLATLITTRVATRGAEWTVVQDLMPQRGYDKGNPFEPLMEIYGLGYWPIGITPDLNGKKEFVVFIPSLQKTA